MKYELVVGSFFDCVLGCNLGTDGFCIVMGVVLPTRKGSYSALFPAGEERCGHHFDECFSFVSY